MKADYKTIIIDGKPIPWTPEGGFGDVTREGATWRGQWFPWTVENDECFTALVEAKKLLRSAVGGLDRNMDRDNELRNRIWKVLGARPHDDIDRNPVHPNDCVDCHGTGVTAEDVEVVCPTCRGEGWRVGKKN